MASPRLKREQSFDFEEASAQEAMGSASASYSPPGGVFGISPPESSPRDGRKRRKDRPSWVKRTFTPHFDGHLWRKYGQKNIKDSSFPRLYYRCSYREDRQCLASKLVQQENDDDPPLYKVTYTYEHTCNTTPVPTPDVVAEQPAPAAGDAYLLRFGSSASGGIHGDAHQQIERDQRQQQQHSARRPFMMLSFDSSSHLHEQQHEFPPDQLPSAASPSFTAEALPPPVPPPTTTTNDGGDLFSTWDSFRYGLDDDHAHLGNHVYLPDDCSGGDDNY
ncbi:hypothetical protein E2562_023999 [Oryza meyeriana var. granulata]|uniref:WRKY domain-containing protein n=1 Tax=Oryza meyeriana var. granulata TaxID=110450 RepID=A0A6G1EBC4_9ORYZ|nr:hypothetical protein E2562_023999 [Oryza meyeriana var. granulata]